MNDVGTLGDFNIMTLPELVDVNNPFCGDVGNELPMLSYLRDFFDNQSIQGCQDVQPWCSSLTKMPECHGITCLLRG